MLGKLKYIILTVIASVSFVTLLNNLPVNAMVGQWAPTSINKIANYNNHTCSIADNNVFCWGRNNFGQLGIGTTDTNNHMLPEKVVGTAFSGKTITRISVGGTGFACAIANGWPYCWGRNTYGQLGTANTTSYSVPTAVVDTNGVLFGKTVTDISLGDGHACVIANGKPYCWGANGNGRLGDGTYNASNSPVAVYQAGVLNGVTVTSIASGSAHVCVAGSKSGASRVYCWGEGSVGNLGRNSTDDSNVPVEVSTTVGDMLTKNVQIMASGLSNRTSCALTQSPDNKIYCWGDGSGGQIGNNNAANKLVPTAVISTGALSGKTIQNVYLGNLRACALDSNGESYCWGVKYTGSGNTNEVTASPDKVLTSGVLNGVAIKDMGVGADRCAIGTNNRAYCWGINTYGEIGDNSITDRTVPVEVLARDNVTNSDYRFYRNANSVTPGSPFAANSTPAKLEWTGQAFRMRMGIKTAQVSNTQIDIRPSDANIKLQFALRSGSSCSTQTTGFSDVTSTTTIAWNTNPGVTNGSAITSYTNDPVTPGAKIYQTYRSADGSFVNTFMIPNGSTGMWDFSLKDGGMVSGSSYCLRLVYDNGTLLESTPVSYPEIQAPEGELSIGIVNSAGNPVSQPVFNMDNALVSNKCQTINGTLGTSGQSFRITNSLSTTGWSVSLAATNGPTAIWNRSDGLVKYDFNDNSGSPAGCNSGSDGDGVAGQLKVMPSFGAVIAKSGCTNNGITKGSAASFIQGSVDAITLLNASSSTDMGCYWDLTGVNMSQQIPASQPPGVYSIDMTATVVAS